MNYKILITILVIIIALLGVALIYNSTLSPDNYDKNTSLNNSDASFTVSSEGPYKLKDITDNIRNDTYFEGYDINTLKWMESLGDKYVFVSRDEYIIMDYYDSKKVPSVFVTDAYIEIFIECDVIENHSLGNGDNLKDVYLVKNVNYLGNNTYYYEV